MKANNFRFLFLALAFIYIISPVDFVPDILPVAGLADDVLIGLAAAMTALVSIGRNKSIER